MNKIRRMQALIWTGIIVLSLVACADGGDKEMRRMQETSVEEPVEPGGEPDAEGSQEEGAGILYPEEPEKRYEPTEVSLLDYDSFRRRMTEEEWEGFSQYFPVLQEGAAFELAVSGSPTELNREGEIAKEDERVVFYRHTSKETTTVSGFVEDYAGGGVVEAMRIREVRVFDLDGDGTQELILEWTPAGDYLILHRENEDFYGYTLVYRGFEMLQTGGVYIASGGAASNCWRQIRFEDGSWVEELLAEEEWDSYYLKGEAVDEDTFWRQVDDYVTEDVTGYEPQRRAEG
ncbi:MAG: hypothetical protein K2O32_01390 [Acetatifactor sp.]|nr:hypothetical protein [Acetatifactor sp.]